MVRMSKSERVFEVFNVTLLFLLMLITAYPFLYVLFASVSDPAQMMRHTGFLYKPLGFSLESFKMVFQDRNILTGYANTIINLVLGTTINLIFTSLGAYVLSRKGYMWKNAFMGLIMFTMFFGGGLIPNYMLVKNLGGIDQRWSLLLPGAISTWNLIIMRTSFAGIPDSLEESARIEGANDFTILWKIIVPVSKAVIAVMILYYGVGHWNAWFNASLYLQTKKQLYPLQLVLRGILINSSMDEMIAGAGDIARNEVTRTVKYATIIVSTVPVLCMYPFLQKYFIKGVMVGALKE